MREFFDTINKSIETIFIMFVLLCLNALVVNNDSLVFVICFASIIHGTIRLCEYKKEP